jgi:hypothetical protein
MNESGTIERDEEIKRSERKKRMYGNEFNTF